MFYEKIYALCRSRGTSVSAMLQDLDMSTGNNKRWKEGHLPTAESLCRISDYLGVSIDYLLRDEWEAGNRPLTEREVLLLRLFDRLPEQEQDRFIGRLEDRVEAMAST